MRGATLLGDPAELGEIIGKRKDGRAVHAIFGEADGIFYRDSRQPFLIADESPITLATTMKGLWLYPKSILPANYWTVGKLVKVTAWGKATTDGTAGNYVFGLGYGASDAPTSLGSGATVAGSTSQSNITWRAEAWFRCRTTGATGSLMAFGQWAPAVAVLASTLQPYTVPASAAAATSIDTTVGTNSLMMTLQRSSTGVWTATTQELVVEALN
jgi:hypothetical protein